MNHRIYETSYGIIHYWLNVFDHEKPTLVFLPGLTADHRLFNKQIECFEFKYNVFVWDAPGHADSWPFEFNFDLFDKARWLYEILKSENVFYPIIIGQSMGAYVGQVFSQLYPEYLKGFVSIDSAPLQREYITYAEIWLLKRMSPVYYFYPWKSLLKAGSKGVAVTEYGKRLMYEMMMTYDGDKKHYAMLAGHGYRMLAEAYEKNLNYEINCPALLICGKKDKAGSTVRYNKMWHKRTHIPIEWVNDAGHNSNTDQPFVVNNLLEKFILIVKKDIEFSEILE